MLMWHADMAADVALPASHFLSGVANSYAIGSVLRGCYKLGSKGVGLGWQVHRSNSYQEDLCPSQLRDADVSTSGGKMSCANDETSMNDSLMTVVCEQRAPGDSWFIFQKMKLPKGCGYEFQMPYGSIGWSVGATLGYAQAAKDKRIISCIGYCSRCVDNVAMRSESNHFSDNGGCTIKVEIHDGPYNMIKNWNYTALVDAIHNGEGKCWTTKVGCEEDLVEAIETATGENKYCLCFIEVICHKDDTSKELLEWGSRVSAANSRPPHRQ
ncbi:hypothetical protein AgCh_025565 [Apium graveolens]